MKKAWLKTILLSSLALTLIPLSSFAAAKSTQSVKTKASSKNLIVLIGDGMGPAQVSAARIYSKTHLNKPHLNLDAYYVGQATTYADRGEDGGKIVSGVVTDSASAGTAFATGHKTYNAAISVSNEDVSKPFASIIEAAEMKGKSTGLVTTARITHATPAVYASHVRNRDNESAIASQYLTSGVDVLFGGGKSFFVSKAEKGKRADKTILPDFQAKGYKVVTDLSSLNKLTSKDSKALGVFDNSHVPYVLDRKDSVPSLAKMTSKAIDILSQNKEGFTMMIEGGRIDHAGHANDFPSIIQEMLDFDAAVKVAIDFAKKDGNTSVIITADHETGGLSLSRDNIYEMNMDLWGKQKKSSEFLNPLLKEAKTADDVKKIVADYTWINDLSDEEAQTILTGDGSSYEREGGFNEVIAKRLLVGFSGHGHSAVDVGVWAYGPIAAQVRGQIDNTDIAKTAAKIQGLDLEAASAKLQAKHLYPKFKIDRSGNVLYPAKALAASLGLKFEATGNTVKLTKGSKSFSGEADNDQNVLYLPLDAFNQAAGKKMKWDALSERIILN